MSGPPGSQPERTRLAWRRTALALTVTATLAAAAVVHRARPVAAVPALVLVIAAVVGGLTLAQHRVSALGRPGFRQIGRTAPALALLVAVYATVGVALVLATTA